MSKSITVGAYTFKESDATEVKKIIAHKELFQENFLAIDPASKSLGFALYENLNLVSAGTIEHTKGRVGERLYDICHDLIDKVEYSMPIAVEKVRTQTGHVSLTWSVGAVLGAIGPEVEVEVPVRLWKNHKPPGYVKSDLNDAISIAEFVKYIVENA